MTTQQPTHRSLQLEINELRAHRNELMGRRTPTEEVQEFNSTLDEVRDALQGTASDINEAREQVAEYSGHLRAFSQRAGEAMDTPEIREFVQGVNEGLGQTSARIGDVDEVLGRIDSVVGLLETLLDAADAPGDDQIMELADQFGAMVELLSPLIDRIPVLGQFFTLYAMMIRRIAGSLGVIQEIMAERTRIWQMLWPDEVAYNDGGTWESRLENEIRDVQKEIDDRVAQQLELALAGEVPLGRWPRCGGLRAELRDERLRHGIQRVQQRPRVGSTWRGR